MKPTCLLSGDNRSNDTKSPEESQRSHQATCNDCGQVLSEQLTENESNLLPDHTLICPNALVKCPYVQVGCDTSIKRTDLSNHSKSHMAQHMQLLNEQLLKIQQSYICSSSNAHTSALEVYITYSDEVARGSKSQN